MARLPRSPLQPAAARGASARRAGGGATAGGAIRDLGAALSTLDFRIALVLSVLVHLGLLLGLRGVETAPPHRPPVRLHFVTEAPAPRAPAAEPASRPRRSAGEPAAAQRGPREMSSPPATPAPPQPPAGNITAAPAPAPPPVESAPPPAPPPVDAPAPPREAPPAPLPAANTGAVMEPPKAISTTVAAPAESEPVSAPAPARGAADGGAAPSAVSPGVSPGAAAAGGQEAGAGGANPAAPSGPAVPVAVTGPALSGAAERVGPSAQEIAALRRRIDSRKVYPQIAIRNGWEGRVLVEMHLEVDGRLAAVRLVAGSGYSILDEATITAVRLASPFPPIARVVTVPVEYRLIP